MDDEERIDILLNALTLDEKFRLMSGDTPFTTVPDSSFEYPCLRNDRWPPWDRISFGQSFHGDLIFPPQ